MKILGLIPARSGSKGVPDKNQRPLCGRPLVLRAFDSAGDAGVLDRIVVSTDDEAIAALARSAGAEVPFLRPADLAEDAAPMIGVVLHALDALAAQAFVPDAVMLLQPTSPLRRPDHIRTAVSLLGENDSVCSVVLVPQELCPHYVMKIDQDGYLNHFLPDGAHYTRRQDVPAAYRRDGSVYLTRTDVLRKERSFYGHSCVPMVLPPEDSLTIDHAADWAEAEARLARAVGESGSKGGIVSPTNAR